MNDDGDGTIILGLFVAGLLLAVVAFLALSDWSALGVLTIIASLLAVLGIVLFAVARVRRRLNKR